MWSLPLLSIILTASCLFIPIFILSIVNGLHAFTETSLSSFYFPYTVSLSEPTQRKKNSLNTIQYFEDYITLKTKYTMATALLRAYSKRDISKFSLSKKYPSLLLLNKNNIILGKYLAYSLGLYPGSLIQTISFNPSSWNPIHSTVLEVIDTISFNNATLDRSIVLVSAETIPNIFQFPSSTINYIASSHKETLTPLISSGDYITPLSKFPQVKQLQAQSDILRIILISICFVCFFSVFITIHITIDQNFKFIALLKYLGLTTRKIYTTFILQGCFIAFIGLMIGIILCILIIPHLQFFLIQLENIINMIIHFIQSQWPNMISSSYSFQIIPPDIFYHKKIPVELHFTDLMLQSFCIIFFIIVAAILPSQKIFRSPLITYIKN